MRTSRLVPAVIFAVLVSIGITACGPSPEQERKAAFEEYVERERQTIPALIASMPDMYNSVQISGELEAGPSGTAVIHYTYTYRRMVEFGLTTGVQPSWKVPRPSWAEPLVPYSELEAMQSQLKQSCDALIFPAMRDAGITGALRVEFVYLQPTRDVSWDATCEASG